MSARSTLLLVLGVNVLWAAAFFGYVSRRPALPAGPMPAPLAAVTNSSAAKANVAATNAVTAAAAAPGPLNAAGRSYPPRAVEEADYTNYLARLRRAGMPEPRVRSVVVNDVNELYDELRRADAVTNDFNWWRPDSYGAFVGFGMRQIVGPSPDERRAEILTRILGQNWQEQVKLPQVEGAIVKLTGQVLGSLPVDTLNEVHQVIARSQERHGTIYAERMGENGINPLEMQQDLAQLRQMTRTNLAKVLRPEEMVEFLLRYSHNAQNLRQEFRGLDITPEEFRAVFQAVDPIEHNMQLEFGGTNKLSAKQLGEFQRQRELAFKSALTPARFRQWLLTKDPVYNLAQNTAQQYGAPSEAVPKLRDAFLANDAKRQAVLQDKELTPKQKFDAITLLQAERQQAILNIIAQSAGRN